MVTELCQHPLFDSDEHCAFYMEDRQKMYAKIAVLNLPMGEINAFVEVHQASGPQCLW